MLSRLVSALLALAFTLSFVAAYATADEAERLRFQTAASDQGTPFSVPGDPRLADPAVFGPVLEAAAQDAGVNVFRTSAGFTPDGRPTTTHYVLLTGPSAFFEAVTVRSGRALAPGDAQAHLSSGRAEAPGQVGVLPDFGHNDVLAVRPMAAAFASLPTAGHYVVEATTLSAHQAFLTALAARATADGALTPETFVAPGTSYRGSSASGSTVLLGGLAAVMLLTAILLVYTVLYEAKRSAVLRLHGYAGFGVWLALVGKRVVLVSAVCLALTAVAGAFVPDATATFRSDALGRAAWTAFGMLLASWLASAYVRSTRLGESLKNRKDTAALYAANTVLKAACAIVLVSVGAGLWVQYDQVAAQRAKLGGWDQARGYGIFYPKLVGDDLVEAQTGQAGPTSAEVYDLYPVLNASGALYVDAAAFEPQAVAVREQGVVPTLTVNPNYLRAFPILDAAGSPVRVPEDEPDWVLLVPESERAREREILAQVRTGRFGASGSQGALQAEPLVFGRQPSASVAAQGIRIIWTRPGQSVFAFNPEVAPEDGNAVTDPVVQVLTLANSLGLDRSNMITGGGGSALKVALDGGDTSATLASLRPVLEGLRLADNLRHLVTMNEYRDQQLQALERGVRDVALAALGLVTALLVLAVQSLAIVFERHARRVVVRRLHGQGFLLRYREFLAVFALTWVVQAVGGVLANRAGVSPFATADAPLVAPDATVLLVAALVVAVEFAFSVVVLSWIEGRNLVTVLKGEF